MDRDAVTAETRARVERCEAERLGAGGLNNFPDVDIHAVTKELQLVNQSDVHGPVDVFQEFDQLRCPCRGYGYYTIDHLDIQRCSDLQAVGRDSTDHLRDCPCGKLRVALSGLAFEAVPLGYGGCKIRPR